MFETRRMIEMYRLKNVVIFIQTEKKLIIIVIVITIIIK